MRFLGAVIAACQLLIWAHSESEAGLYSQLMVKQTTIPTITSVIPNTGGTVGGTIVRIKGANLALITSVTFGGALASFSMSGSDLLATAPAGLGAVVVQVSGSQGSSTAPFTFQNWKQSWAASSASSDCNHIALSATEARIIITHTFLAGAILPCGAAATVPTPAVLIATGLFDDNACAPGQGPQVLALLSPTGTWNQDFMFPTVSGGCGGTNFGISIANSLIDACFRYDATGAVISPPQCVLVAGGPATPGSTPPAIAGQHFYARKDATGEWLPFATGNVQEAMRGSGQHDDASSSPTISYVIFGNDGATPISEKFTPSPFGFTTEANEPFAISPFTSAGTCNKLWAGRGGLGTGTPDQSSTNCSNYNSLWPAGTPTATTGGVCVSVIPCQPGHTSVRTLAMTDCAGSFYGAFGWEVRRRVDHQAQSYWVPVGVIPYPDTDTYSQNGIRGLSCIQYPSASSGFALLSGPEDLNGSIYRWDVNATLPIITNYASANGGAATTLSWSTANPFSGPLVSGTGFTVTGITGYTGANPNNAYNGTYTVGGAGVTVGTNSITIPVAYSCASCSGGQINVVPTKEADAQALGQSAWSLPIRPGYGIVAYNGSSIRPIIDPANGHLDYFMGLGTLNTKGYAGNTQSYYNEGAAGGNKYGAAGIVVRSGGGTYTLFPASPNTDSINNIAALNMPYGGASAPSLQSGYAFCLSPSTGPTPQCAITAAFRDIILSPFAADGAGSPEGSQVLYLSTFDVGSAYPMHDTAGAFTVPIHGAGVSFP